MTKEEIELNKKILLEMGNMLHPHLGDDNYTNRLMLKLFNGEYLSSTEYFDLGKYYVSMLQFCQDHSERLSAVLWLKRLI